MRIFNNVDPKNIIIIDNSVLSFAFQLHNGIPILPFYNNKYDNELSYLSHYLNRIAKCDDLREENKKSFKLDYYLHSIEEKSLIELKNEHEKSLFTLKICGDTTIDEDNYSADSLQINSNTKEEISSSKISTKIFKTQNKRLTGIPDQFLKTMSDLKKSLEDNLKQRLKN